MSFNISSNHCSAILNLPPEIFPLIALHIPLQHLPATLSALALTSSALYSYVNPVLYIKVIVKKARYASGILDRIALDEALALLPREFHLRINVATEIEHERSRPTIFSKLKEVIKKGCLPQLRYLSLVILKSSDYPGLSETDLLADYVLPRSFWATLRRFCPLLQGIRVEGIHDTLGEPWENECGFYDLEDFLGLSTISLKYDFGFPSQECFIRLCKNVVSLASTLQSLTLVFEGATQPVCGLLRNTFPHLTSISLYGIEPNYSITDEAMAFWTRHRNLQHISLNEVIGSRWFSDRVEHGLLPRLTHLKAGFDDVRALETHLRQLERLCVSNSYNSQVPYLLCAVLRDGLPKLKSLEIYQVRCAERFITFTEGAMWHETIDGQFVQETSPKNAWKGVDDAYVNSIVQGAPNLEELCLHDQSSPFHMDILTQISPFLGRLVSLKRLYFSTFPSSQKIIEHADLDGFLLKCGLLGDSCRSLDMVIDIGIFKHGPYLVGGIMRDSGGSVQAEISRHGFGMELTNGGDDPFPLNKPL